MTTLIDILHTFGQATWHPLWIPIILWTLLALPLCAGLEWTDRLHPLAEYRLAQVVLAALPLGLVAAAFADLFLRPPQLPLVALQPVSVSPAEGMPAASASDLAWTWMHTVGLLTVGGTGTALWSLARLAVDADAVRRLRATLADGRNPEAHRELDQITEALGLDRPVESRVCSEVAIPVTLGGGPPLILLPDGLAETPTARRMTLMHECLHVRRYDDVATVVERLVAALFRIHPLVGRLATYIDGARERACDAELLDDPQTEAHEYAQLLMSFADRRHEPIAALSLSESPSSLKTRLTAMNSTLPHWLRSRFSLRIAGLTLGLTLILGIGGCSESVSPAADDEQPSADSTPKSVSTPQDLQRPPEIEGGLDALSAHVEYPTVAKEAGIHGRVFVEFVVSTEGQARDVRVSRGVHESLDSAAIHAVRSVEFVPGRTDDGSAVPTKMTLPVSFQLPNEAPDDDAKSSVGAAPSGTSPRAPRIEGGMEALRDKISYPDLAKKAGIEGTVIVTVTVNENGGIKRARVERGVHDALDAAALHAVRQVRFTPPTSVGASSPIQVSLPIRFALPGDGGDA